MDILYISLLIIVMIALLGLGYWARNCGLAAKISTGHAIIALIIIIIGWFGYYVFWDEGGPAEVMYTMYGLTGLLLVLVIVNIYNKKSTKNKKKFLTSAIISTIGTIAALGLIISQMDYVQNVGHIFVIGLVGLISMFIWFRNKLDDIGAKTYLAGIVAFLGGLFSAGILLFLLGGSIITQNPLYSGLIGPFFEELVKFVIVYLIINSLSKKDITTAVGMGIGIFVGLGFGMYENIVYILDGVTDIKVLLFRSIFVGGVLIHPLTTGIYGMTMSIAKQSGQIMKGVFNSDSTKNQMTHLSNIGSLIKYIYKKSNKSIQVIIDFIVKILTLNILAKYVLGNKKLQTSLFGHGPVEIIFEGFFMGLWIHIIYNSMISYMLEPSTALAILTTIAAIMLLQLLKAFLNSKIMAYVVTITMISGFVTQGATSEKLLMIGMILVTCILFLISLKMNSILNYEEK